MKEFRVLTVIAVVVVVVLISSSFYFLSSERNRSNYVGGYLSESQLDKINITSPGVNISKSTSTIFVNTSANLPVFMGPMNSGSMYSFEILGVINPKIIVSEGATIHFVIVNVDTDSEHNFVLTTISPPYDYMIGEGMMGSSRGGFMTTMDFLPPVHSDRYAFENVSYNFSSSGTFWYVCTYPGHAQKGMFGEISVVKQA